jgi:PBP1b-binding outer membrane lipoprotein LpoB
MKKIVTVLAIAALMTSCQKEDLSGACESTTQESKQLTQANGQWNVNYMFDGSEPVQISVKTIRIEGDVILTYYVNGMNTSESFYIDWSEPNTLITDNDNLVLSHNPTEGTIEILYTQTNLTIKAVR